MLYTRQKELLFLISKLQAAGKTQLQKLEFLFSQQTDSPSYGFFPYKYGPYSLILQKDLDYLTSNGYLTFQSEQYYNNNSGTLPILPTRKTTLETLVQRFGSYRVTALMGYVYRKYPEFAINSERVGDILTPEELSEVYKHKPVTNVPHLYTIGYEGRSIDDYLNQLVMNGIRKLIDVRANGVSMKPEFSAKRLANSCSLLGILYEHIPRLGIASVKRKGIADKAELFNEYRNELVCDRIEHLNELRETICVAKRVALTCFERDACDCHRSILAVEVCSMLPDTFKLSHL